MMPVVVSYSSFSSAIICTNRPQAVRVYMAFPLPIADRQWPPFSSSTIHLDVALERKDNASWAPAGSASARLRLGFFLQKKAKEAKRSPKTNKRISWSWSMPLLFPCSPLSSSAFMPSSCNEHSNEKEQDRAWAPWVGWHIARSRGEKRNPAARRALKESSRHRLRPLWKRRRAVFQLLA